MKIVWLSDVHLEHSVKSDNIDGERQSILTLDVLSEHILNEKPGAVVVNGDLFDLHGVIESSLACIVKDRINDLVVKSYDWIPGGMKVVLITGNHEYQEVTDRYFGQGLLSAVFAGVSSNIKVIDKKAEFVRLDDDHVVFGIPYRANHEQFRRDAMIPFEQGVSDLKKKDRLFIGWHVGLPFGNTFRDGEDESSWITHDHPDIKLLFSRVYDKTIYLGHYHEADELPCGDGKFIYIGSQATRTRAESEQTKSFLVWENGESRRVNTQLELDKMFSSIEEAAQHLNKLEKLFGHGVRQIATMHVNLGEDATMDKYLKARDAASKIVGSIKIERPKKMQRSVCEHIIKKHSTDPTSTREKMQSDLFHFALLRDYRSGVLQHLSDHEMYIFGLIEPENYENWLSQPISADEKFSQMTLSSIVKCFESVEASTVFQPFKFASNEKERKISEAVGSLKNEDLNVLWSYARDAKIAREIEFAVT